MDRRRAASVADALFTALCAARRASGGSGGVDLPHREDSPLIISLLLKKHPEVKVIRMGTAMTIVFDEALKAGTSEELYNSFKSKGAIFGSEDE